MSKRGRKKRRSLDDAMRWSLDMGSTDNKRNSRPARPARDDSPPLRSKDGEPITLPPDPPTKPERPPPQPATDDDSAVQITRR